MSGSTVQVKYQVNKVGQQCKSDIKSTEWVSNASQISSQQCKSKSSCYVISREDRLKSIRGIYRMRITAHAMRFISCVFRGVPY